LKHRYPLTPMERYVRWRRPDRAPFDPWLRVHRELGARVLGVARRSMVVQGSVVQVGAVDRDAVPGKRPIRRVRALAPVTIDQRRDRGRYVEPNVWMLHPL
jgi:hypothetical protein